MDAATTTTAAAATKPTRRAFYRCTNCCHVFAIEQTERGAVPNLTCACEGVCAFMGFVGRGGTRLFDEGKRCPCDARCTHAKGPHCDCSCGGANHGSHALVTVIIDLGKAPKIRMLDTAAIMARAAEYKAAREPLVAELQRLADEKRASGWLSDAGFRRSCELRRILNRAAELKSHKSRIKALTEAATAA